MVETDTKPPVRRTKVRPGWFLFVAKKYKLIEKTRLSSFYLAFKKGSFFAVQTFFTSQIMSRVRYLPQHNEKVRLYLHRISK